MNTITSESIQASKPRRKRHLLPLFVLLLLTPAISELLLGDMELNSSILFLFLLNVSYYGTGAIIIREIVRRRGLHWGWIPILAFAYGLIEEGLVLHSLFNPNFPGISAMGYFGHALGVSWVWSPYVLGLHTVWSISVPILVTELIFPRVRQESWIGNIGLSIIGIIFVLGMAFLTYVYANFVTPNFKPDTFWLVVTGLLALIIISLALFLPVKHDETENSEPTQKNAPNSWLVGLFGLVVGAAFLFFHRSFELLPSLPAVVAALIYLMLAALAILFITRWSAPGRGWNDRHRVALAFAALLNYCAIGFGVSKSDILNQSFHGVIVVITIILMILLTLRVRARNQSEPQTETQVQP
ncbi:hypothetical protein [Ktedonospora formicarum]|uniref:Uncharacterized protein n=1 Tax=Ktedonospora formicarum TaxID=2778364 RepID=A0A8J3MU56_9CHLR|nr:hypothetical protein [Ktedonospora formicarum]GHO47860.1 hypothetical protein KSX_60230 [Ktedonospora formicarum]